MIDQINTILLEISRAIDWYQNYKMQHFTFEINKSLNKFYVVKIFLDFFYLIFGGKSFLKND